MADLLTIQQAAERMQVHPRSVRRLIDSGRLAAVVIGPRTRRIRPETLVRFMQEAECLSEKTPTPDTPRSHGSRRFTATADELDAALGLDPKPRHLMLIRGADSSRED